MDDISHPHDRFFKNTMSQINVAKLFFRQYLPKKVLSAINLDTLSINKSSYVDKHLKLVESDLLFSVNANGEKGYIYLLSEHQSTVDRLMPFRLMKYIINIIDDHVKTRKKTEKLPLVIPIVFYHGRRPYNCSTDFFDLFEDPRLAREVLMQPFTLVDVQKQDEFSKTNHWLSLMLQLMKYIRSKHLIGQLESLLPLMSKVVEEGGMAYVEASFTYILEAGHLPSHYELIELVKRVSVAPEVKQMAMSAANQLRQEGLQEGRQEGRRQGRQQGREEGLSLGLSKGRRMAAEQIARDLLEEGLDLSMVQRVTQLPLEYLKNLLVKEPVN